MGRRIIRRLRGLIRSIKDWLNPPPPTLEGAYHTLNGLVNDFDDWKFYLSRIKGLKLSEHQIMFLERTDFNLSTLRDEILIDVRKAHLEKQMERFKHGK